MASAPPTSRVPGVTLTDEQRADFAARVRREALGGPRRDATSDILTVLPHDRAVALTADLWSECEPIRRRREWWFRVYAWVSLGLFVALMACFATFGLLYSGRPAPSWLTDLQYIFHANQFVGTAFLSRRMLSPEQRGCIPVLAALRDPRLTPALMDALTIRDLSGADRYRPALRLALVDTLPVYATSDLPPLDLYQRNILRREIKRYARRLRKPAAKIDPAESAFVAAAVRYLSEVAALHPAAPAEGKATAQTTALVQTLAALPPDADPNDVHCCVRAMARECLPRLTAGRR